MVAENGSERVDAGEDQPGSTGHALQTLRPHPDATLVGGVAIGLLADLTEALGREPDADEAVAWATMSPVNRMTTLRRIHVLERWVRDRGDLTAAAAAREAGLKLSRWYDVAARWSAGSRSIFDVGRFARGQQDRKGRFDADLLNELQGAVPRIVAQHDVADRRPLPAARMVELLVASVDARGRRLPAFNTLREMVERERRRVGTRSQAGTQPGFDMVGSGLLRPDGRQHLIFGVVDRTSRLMLGYALGDFEQSVAGHARAAEDALSRLRSPEFGSVPWAGAAARIDIVPGGDGDAWSRVDFRTCPVDCGFAEGRKSLGGYFRRVVGPSIGRLRLSAVKTAIRPRNVDADVEVFDDEAALLRIRVEIAAHNATILREMEIGGEPAPAPTLEAALKWVRGLDA